MTYLKNKLYKPKMTIFKLLESHGVKLTTDSGQTYYKTEELQKVLEDIEDEGSGQLNVYFDDLNFLNILNNIGKYYTYIESSFVIQLLLDESDIELPLLINCINNCKCINCSKELQEINETICSVDCKCVNCFTN